MKNFLKFFLVTVLALSFVPVVNAQQNADVDPEGTSSCLDITMSLRYRDNDAKTNGQISQLQDFLVSQGYMTGNPTGYFGLVTFAGVKKFQSQYGFSPTGFVGPLTKGKIKDITCNGNGGTISIPPIPVTPTNPSDRSNSNNNLPKGCTSNTLFNPLTGERCVEVRSVGSFTITPNFVNKTIELGEKFEQAFSVKTDYDEQKDGRYFTWILGKGSMPEGLSLSNTEGWRTIVSGTPKTKGAYSFTVEAYSIQNKEKVASSLVYLNVGPSTSSIQPYISMVAGKGAGNFEIDAGSSSYISGGNLSNVSVSVGGKLATVTQTGDSYIYATMPSDLVPGQTYDLFVYRGLSGIYSNVVKVKVLSKVSSTQPSITVLSPNGGEKLLIGNKYEVRWFSSNDSNFVRLFLMPGNIPITSMANAAAGFSSPFSWTINTNILPGQYKIEARLYTDSGNVPSQISSDQSDNYFTITSTISSTQPSITVLSPNGGENLQVGSTYKITWKDSREKGLPQLYNVSFFGSNSKEFIRENVNWSSCVNGICSIDWTVHSSISSNNYISIYDVANDYSGSFVSRSGYFNIVSPTSSTQSSISSIYLVNNTRDRAGIWNNFGPGAGNINKNINDWEWSLSINLPERKTINRITIIHNTKGEVWSTGYSRYLSDGTDLYGYNEHPYPLVVSTGLSSQNTAYDQSLGSWGPSSMAFVLNGQPESARFTGGKVIVEFSDGIVITKEIPASDYNSSGNTSSTQPTTTVYPAKISSISPSKAQSDSLITIYGSYFSTDVSNRVSFKGTGPSSVSTTLYAVASSSSRIVLRTPPLVSGEYSVSVISGSLEKDYVSNPVAFWIENPVYSTYDVRKDPLTIYGPWVVKTQSSTLYIADEVQFTSTYGGDYSYDCGDGGVLTQKTTYGTFYCVYSSGGFKKVSISDKTGVIASKTINVIDKGSSTQPLEVSCYGYVPTNTSNIVWTSSAGGISPISYSWTLTDDVATYFGGSPSSSSISASYSSAGTKSASIRVSDGLGRSTKASCQAVITTEPASYPAKISTISPNRARVGDPVIIYGSDFNTSINNSVNITGNGAGAMVPSSTKSATQTSFIVPSMPAGTYSLYVNNNKGKGNSNSVSFSIDLATSTSSFNSNQDMTANMFEALRSVNPSLYR